jgi:LuxR family maltose regulon positive regulatory protein
MQAPLLTTKLNIPPLRPHHVPRSRLTSQLNSNLSAGNQLLRKLSFISAPAGYGKTTLVLEWLDQLSNLSAENFSPSRAAWLTLDENDNDPVRFISYILAAIQRIQPGYGDGTKALLGSAQLPPEEIILTTLLNEMDAISGVFFLVLDDYHSIHTPDIHQQVAFLLEHQPAHMHLVLVTREDPLLPLSRLRAGGDMVEIRQEDLRFSPEECAKFLQDVMGIPLSRAEIEALERRTEGWIAGLQLAAFSMQGLEDTTGFIRAFTGSHRFILDYLMEEVYRRQPKTTRDFLLKTSILDRLCGSLCDAVAGVESSQKILEHLDHANLFITPLDQSREWYRYHRLFADLLHHRLRQAKGIQESDLQNRASRWFEENNHLPESIEHAIKASNWERAKVLVSSINSEMLKRGENATLHRWYNQFPREVLLENPKICLDYCWILLLSGQFDKSVPLLDRLEKIAPENSAFLGEIMTAQAYQARGQGDNARMVDRSQQARKLLPKDSADSRGIVTLNLVLAYWHMGDMAATEETLTESLEAAKSSGNHYALITGKIFQGRVHAVRGKLKKAANFFHEAIEQGRQMPINALAHMDLGTLHYEWNNLEDSTQHLENALAISQRDKNDEFSAVGWMLLARTRLAQGNLAGAVEILSKSQELVQTGAIPVGNAARVNQMAVLLALAQGDLKAANMHAATLEDQLGSNQVARLDVHPFYRFLGITKARLMIANQELKAARQYLGDLESAAIQGDWGYGLIAVRVWQALAAEDMEKSIKYLREALQTAGPEGYLQTFIEAGPPLLPYLTEADRRGIGPGYVNRITEAIGIAGEIAADQSSLVEPLSPRELEVLGLLAAGLSNRQIAEKLIISLGTAKTHIHNIYGKLEVSNRAQAIARAREHHLV